MAKPKPIKTYSVVQAARLIGCNPETIRRAIRKGELPVTNPGGREYAITHKDLTRFHQARTGQTLSVADTPAAMFELEAYLNEHGKRIPADEDLWPVLIDCFRMEPPDQYHYQVKAVFLKDANVGAVLWGTPEGLGSLYLMAPEDFQQGVAGKIKTETFECRPVKGRGKE